MSLQKSTRPAVEQKTAAPAITLPKGGGAIRGMGEKFAANPVTGTGSMSVPIAVSPGRSGFGPQLSLAYDSGTGNGTFGFGWDLSLPAITRKTDKGLPQYRDAEGSDVIILSGAEDLVPVLIDKGEGKWELEQLPPRTVDGKPYHIQRYRPRTEGLFARIERWTNQTDPGDTFWRSISKDNITTWYGKTPESRISDPVDATHVFSWLICESYDDKGSVIVYGYKREDSARIFEDTLGNALVKAHERNRTTGSRSAQRYLKRIRYGHRAPYFPVLKDDAPWPEPQDAAAPDGSNSWLFEVVFDYGEHDANAPTPIGTGKWPARSDPFSSYRSGFEVRTYRSCQRVLMFHHFPGEIDVGRDCLVRSTDFTYSDEVDPTDVRNPVYTFLRSVTQTGYRRNNGGYGRRSLPPVEFKYTEPTVQDTVEEVDPESLENLPVGLDGSAYRWTDLHGEGIPGILTEQAGTWFYKRNLSPIPERLSDGRELFKARFAPLETVALKPNLVLSGGAEFMDLAGDGQPDVVVMDGPAPGLFEHDEAEGWQNFRPFTSRLNRDMSDPNLKFVDLDGDGHADVLITENDALIWHASLAEEGFGPASRVVRSLDEEKGPRIVFADGTQSIYLADLSGDGLTDMVRIRNGEVCYWPNLGYGHFGAKVTMDHAPRFDNPDQFDHKRIRLADIDGSGTTDIIYLHRDGVRLFFNQSGNGWSEPQVLRVFPRVDDLLSIVPTDLLGNGTACLVWSSSLPGDSTQPMRYVNLMGGQKPHMLIKTVNNLGAETRVDYAPSTKFYLQDKRDGKPWITKLPFPVHVVERVETYDHISRNRFVTRYAYHHGYFDGEEREFRGFGMVEQFDTEEFTALSESVTFPVGDNIDTASHVPPVHSRTWFHTGAYLGNNHVSDFFAGLLDATDHGEYYREPGLTDAQAQGLLLRDTILPADLTLDEEREACRALKGAMLRQEVYALDGTDKAQHPYTVTEQNFTIRRLQPRAENRHGVFFTHAREAVSYHYERNPSDPRTQHALTLEVDPYGNVLREAAIAYGRRPGLSPLQGDDKSKQEQPLITYTENGFTDEIEANDDYRTPLPAEARTYEVTGLRDATDTSRFAFEEIAGECNAAALLDYEKAPTPGQKQKRLIEHVRTRYRKNDLTDLLPPGVVESLALPGESYKLAFTPGLARQAYVDSGKLSTAELDNILANEGRYVLEGDANWWIPSGRIFFSPGSTDTPAEELDYARRHFFLPHRSRDPFHTDTISTESFIRYDIHDLLMLESRDALDNRVTVEANDYRVLQPRLMSDPNRNQTAVAFDILGMVAGTAVMGKNGENLGDSLAGFLADLTQSQLDSFHDAADPHTSAPDLLKNATTRIIYDLDRFHRTQRAHPQDPTKWLPTYAATLARESHAGDPLPPEGLKIQIGFSYSDGFGREIQMKIQAEPEKINGVVGPARWVGSGWTIFNNKGKPVRQYEPFFSQLPPAERHHFEFGVQVGVSPILFYDPVERVVATLHPNHTWEKVLFDPWRQESWDVSDTLLIADPKTDPDVGDFFRRLPDADYLPTWHAQRQGAALGSHEETAARKAAIHAATPRVVHLDSLGRTFLSIAHNRFKYSNTPPADPPVEEFHHTRVVFDIEGNQRAVIDANDRIVMRYDYDLLGNVVHQLSMEAGGRRMLNDIVGKPLYAWDSRDHTFRTEYDPLRRPLRSFATGVNPDNPNQVLLTERLVYGEQHPQAELRNLRGKLYLYLDQAGVVTSEAHDFKGNPLRASRRVATQYQQALNWGTVDAVLPGNATALLDPAALKAALATALEADTYTSLTAYDALNRPVQLIAPRSDQPSAKRNVIQPVYNEANLLERLHVWLDHPSEPAGLLNAAVVPPSPVGVNNIDYDAKGQRLRIDYKNGASTRYAYDPETFRLIHLYTRRGAAFTQDCGGDPPPPRFAAPDVPPDNKPCGLQNLHYTYDPAGNITHIQDDAQQTIYFRNHRVEPSADYTYDAIYRLIEATGREHLGQVGAPVPSSYNDKPRVGIVSFSPNQAEAMGRYLQSYVYDAVGNFEQMIHRGTDPTHQGWTRDYAYDEASLIEPTKPSNRLSRTTIGATTETYSTNGAGYDAHGNMLRMPHLHVMRWDFRDQLQMTQRQAISTDDDEDAQRHGERTWYVYGAGGQRVRKVTELATGRIKDERIYLGGFEVYRKHGANPLVRETLHIMDDQQRVALVETRTLGNDGSPAQLIRYQFGNHLGSASLELDHAARVISYEEYTPYGSTSYQAGRSAAEVSLKRYRYTGMERDEESGLSYHSARYYAGWLGRWLSADPAGLTDGANLYVYVRLNPVRLIDPTGNDSSEPDVPSGEDIAQMERRLQQINAQIAKQKAIVARHDALAKAKAALVELKPALVDLQKRTAAAKADIADKVESIQGGQYWIRRLSNESRIPSPGEFVSEILISKIPPSLVLPYVKDSILVDHFEFTPPGDNPYQNFSDRIARRWSATGARKTQFWYDTGVSVTGAGVAVGNVSNTAAKATRVLNVPNRLARSAEILAESQVTGLQRVAFSACVGGAGPCVPNAVNSIRRTLGIKPVAMRQAAVTTAETAHGANIGARMDALNLAKSEGALRLSSGQTRLARDGGTLVDADYLVITPNHALHLTVRNGAGTIVDNAASSPLMADSFSPGTFFYRVLGGQ
jgi:RHS repeat-associated protein